MTREPERKASTADFMHNALKLRREVIDLLLRDFGIKGKVYNRIKDARIDEASANTLADIAVRYNMAEEDTAAVENVIHNCTYDEREIGKYPEWLVTYYRTAVMHSLDRLMMHLYTANSIFISEKAPEEEYRTRRVHWDMACGELRNLASWLNTVRQTLPVDANKYDHYIERIKRELAMLKGVKAADNKVLTNILKRMAAKQK